MSERTVMVNLNQQNEFLLLKSLDQNLGILVSNDEILTRLTAIENQLESTNQFLGAIDWKMWLYLKAENYIDD
jgi:hypothetical protein